MAQPTLDLPAEFDAWTLAEWVEATMLLDPEGDVSRTSLLRAFASGNEPDAAELDELFAEIRRRADAAPKCYPFRVTADGVITLDSGVDRRVYEFLQLLSAEIAGDRAGEIPGPVLGALALLVREAATAIYANGRAVRFRSPDIDGRPRKLVDAVDWLSKMNGALAGDVAQLTGAETDPGFDVVAWRPFADGAGLVDRLFVQTSLTADMRVVPGDISPGDWQRVFGFAAAPRLALATPFAVAPLSTEAQDLGERVDVLLDRLRLCELLDGTALAGYEREWKEIREWIASQRTQSPKGAAAPPGPRAARKPNPFRRK